MGKRQSFDIKVSYFNAMLSMSGPITVFYHILDIPEDIHKLFLGVVEKNKLAIINDHFD